MDAETLSFALAASAGLCAYGVRGRSASLFGPSIWQGAGTRPSLALTFDDGPSECTEELLDALHTLKVPATFFQCGANVLRLPQVARAVVAEGHEVGNHGHTHAPLYLRSGRFIAEELNRAQDAIGEVTGVRATLFRAPFGARWFGLRRAQKKLGLMGVMWTVIGLDWRLPAAAIAARVMDNVHSGGIVCLHDGHETRVKPNRRPTIEAVRRLVPELRDRGFDFETVSDLCRPEWPDEAAAAAL
jgi:peptidoglycan/xylan/chitin deacetylase (PgdA/CDA1 family)